MSTSVSGLPGYSADQSPQRKRRAHRGRCSPERSTVSEPSRSNNWYEILGLEPNATDAEIGRAFRRLAREFHPDTMVDRSSDSDARFEEIARAYEVLGHPERRADYDRSRAVSSEGRGRRIPVRNTTTTRSARGQASPRPPTGTGSRTSGPEPVLSLSFRESLTGAMRTIDIEVDESCVGCQGTGRISGDRCSDCDGKGRIDRNAGTIAIHHVCDACHGSGQRPPSACHECTGSGSRRAVRHLTIRVPPGVRNGSRIRIPRPSPGDALLATVRVETDERFARDGDEIVATVPITIAEAILGASVTTNSPLGGKVEITVPPGTTSGTRLDVAVPGLAAGSSLRFIVELRIDIPTELSPEERSALELFARVTRSPRDP